MMESLPEVVHDLVLFEGATVDNGGHVWPSAVALSSLFCAAGSGARIAGVPELRGARCLELGAGVGLVGLQLAAQGARVLCTDHDPNALELLGGSIAANGLGDWVSTKLLDWNDPQSWQTAERFDLVLAADCVYPATHEAFAAALIGHVPAGSETPIIMAYQHRGDASERFFSLMQEDGFVLQRLETNSLVLASSRPHDMSNGVFAALSSIESVRSATHAPSGAGLSDVQIFRISREFLS